MKLIGHCKRKKMQKLITINLLLIGLFFVTSCNSEKEQTKIGNEINIPKIIFDGTVILDEMKESITAIHIKKQGTDEVVQIIEDLELPYQEGNPYCEKPTFEDLNFDGIPDLRMPESMGSANVYYIYWIYNPANQKFERNTEMDLCLPTIDAEKKQIQSFSKGSAAEYTETTYGVEKGKFISLKVEDRAYSSETTYHSIIHERQADGTMKKVKDETVEEKE